MSIWHRARHTSIQVSCVLMPERVKTCHPCQICWNAKTSRNALKEAMAAAAAAEDCASFVWCTADRQGACIHKDIIKCIIMVPTYTNMMKVFAVWWVSNVCLGHCNCWTWVARSALCLSCQGCIMFELDALFLRSACACCTGVMLMLILSCRSALCFE